MFCNDPPESETRCYEICRARPRNPLRVCVLNTTYLGVFTHWWNDKTIACPGKPHCEACESNVKVVWFGHFIVRRLDDDKEVLAVFTQPCLKVVNSMWRDGIGLFGARLQFQRVGKRPTSPLYVTTGGHEDGEIETPMVILEKVLTRLYADNANKQSRQFGKPDTPSTN